MDSNHIDYDHDHTVCQKMKGENECFRMTVSNRFFNVSREWKLDEDVKDQIDLILELILHKAEAPEVQTSYELGYCEKITRLNEFHKIGFFKMSYFLECLEKSKLSLAHLDRIQVALELGIWNSLEIEDWFEEMTSLYALYECKCGVMISSYDIEEISKLFYLSVRTKCKECFKKEMKSRKEGKAKSEKKTGPMIKMYLCMKCGEDNYVNFYERNKSKCKYCILQEKRVGGKLLNGVELAPSASKSHHCKVCHTEDPKNFRETYKSLCYACFLVEKREKYRSERSNEVSGMEGSKSERSGPEGSKTHLVKSYFCKDCETTDPEKFRRGYKTQCYTCFLSEKREKRDGKKQESFDQIQNTSGLKVGKLSVLCKYCEDKDPRNFNEGMMTVCARCESLDEQVFFCKTCSLESHRSCFSTSELEKFEMNPSYEMKCNACNPEARVSMEYKEYGCKMCDEKRPEEFYSGMKSLCKSCTRETRRKKYEAKERLLKKFLCSECGTDIPGEFYPGHKSKCKRCL